MEKKCVCPVDGRRFKTPAMLAQHKRDAHGSGQFQASPRRQAPVRRQPMVGTALAEAVRGRQSDSAAMSGVDRVFHGTISADKRSGSVVCDLLVTPGLFKRLAVVARAYQKVRYLSLRFRIEPQVSTTTSGGYVAAFIRDPTDDVKDIDVLTSQQGSMTTKWWQSSVIPAQIPQRDFFTSDSVEVREYSPGRLLMMVDGAATQAGSVTIFAEWSVRLSLAGLEKPGTVSKDIVALDDWWTQAGHIGLFTRKNGRFGDGSVKTMISDFTVGDYFAVEADCVYQGPSKDLNALTWVYVKGANDLIPCWGERIDRDETALPHSKRVVRAGTILRRYKYPTAVGEGQGPPSSVLQTTTVASADPCDRLVQLLRQVISLSEKSETFSEKSDSCSPDCLRPVAQSGCTG